MLDKAIGTLTYADIEALVTNSVHESRTLDFKRDLIGRTDEDKREFLADVSSFANTAGGDLVLGVEEDQGVAVSIPGLELTDPDAEILRLESIVRSGLEPRLPRTEPRWISGSNGRGVLVVRTPRSWAAPHRVVFRDHAKFYGRSSAGKYPLDVAELRSAFVNAEGVVQSIRRFRQERVAMIEAGEGPVLLQQGAKVLFHVIPLSAFVDSSQITFEADRDAIRPLGLSSGGFATRHTLEGLVNYTGREDVVDSVYAYTLLFRSGIIEAAGAIGSSDSHGPFVAPEAVEWPLQRDFKVYKEFLARHSVEPPYYIFISLVGIRDHRIYLRRHIFSPTLTQRQDILLLPELTVDDSSQPAEKILRPLFDLFWNAFGFSRSPNFDESGKYVGER